MLAFYQFPSLTPFPFAACPSACSVGSFWLLLCSAALISTAWRSPGVCMSARDSVLRWPFSDCQLGLPVEGTPGRGHSLPRWTRRRRRWGGREGVPGLLPTTRRVPEFLHWQLCNASLQPLPCPCPAVAGLSRGQWSGACGCEPPPAAGAAAARPSGAAAIGEGTAEGQGPVGNEEHRETGGRAGWKRNHDD